MALLGRGVRGQRRGERSGGRPRGVRCPRWAERAAGPGAGGAAGASSDPRASITAAAAAVSYRIRLLGNRAALKRGWGGGLPSEDAAEERRIEAFGGRQPSLNFSHSYFVF